MLVASFTLMACGMALAEPPPDCPPVAQAPGAGPTADPTAAITRSALPPADTRDRGFLWRITRGGHSSWLFGTLHVGKRAWAFPGPKTRAALRASDTVALEIDPLDPAMQRRLAVAMSNAPRVPLAPALQQRLDRLTQRECLAPQAIAGFAPEIQIAALTTLLGRREGLDPAYGVDDRIAEWGHAASPKRTVVSLESPELQLKLLQPERADEADAFVDNALAEIESGQALPTLLRVSQVWADGDSQALGAYETWCDCVKTPADRAELKRLLDDRNPGMAARIDALHSRGHRVFAAVGSLHMIGPTGLPAAMAARGYRVEQIVFDNKPPGTTP